MRAMRKRRLRQRAGSDFCRSSRREETIMLRKYVIPSGSSGLPGTIATRGGGPAGLDIPSLATVLVTSESSEHPVDHLFDGRNGPGGTRWVASTEGEQTLVLVFDLPQTIREVDLEAEEPVASRTQVTTLAVSRDGARAIRKLCVRNSTSARRAPPSNTKSGTWPRPA